MKTIFPDEEAGLIVAKEYLQMKIERRSKLDAQPLFFMTSPNFMNVVRFKLKSDCIEKYFEIIDKTKFEGMTQRYIA